MLNRNYPSIDIKKTGKRIKEVCEQHLVTAKELQELLNLGSVQAVYHWFQGERLPNVDNLFAISRLLEVPMDELLVEEAAEIEFHLEFENVRQSNRFLHYWELLCDRYKEHGRSSGPEAES